MTQPERVVFSPSVEALLIRGVGNRMTPKLDQELKGLGFDLSKPLLPGYPLDRWLRAVDLVAANLYPHLKMPEAQWQLGESTVYGFEQTLVGKAMVALTRVIGPRRTLLKFGSMSRTSNNYSRMDAKELGPTEIELVCAPYVGFPEYVQGCIRAVLDVAGAKEPDVRIVSHDLAKEHLVLKATWR